jgi:hypothetical protein
MGQWWAERWKWERDTHRLTVAADGDEVVGFTYLGPSFDEGVRELYAIHVDSGVIGSGALGARGERAGPALLRAGRLVRRRD